MICHPNNKIHPESVLLFRGQSAPQIFCSNRNVIVRVIPDGCLRHIRRVMGQPNGRNLLRKCHDRVQEARPNSIPVPYPRTYIFRRTKENLIPACATRSCGRHKPSDKSSQASQECGAENASASSAAVNTCKKVVRVTYMKSVG